MQRRVGQFDVVHYVPLRHEQIEPSVIIVVDQFRSPARVQHRDSSNPAAVGHVFKKALIVAKQCVLLIGQSIDENVRPAIVVVVREIRTHACKHFSVLVIGHPGSQSDFAEGSVAIVAKQLLREGIICHKDVGPAILIEVVDCYAQSFSQNCADAGRLRDVRERAVAIVVVDQV